MMIKADWNCEAGIRPNERLVAAIAHLAEETARAGLLVEAGGLLPSSQGARVRVTNGELKVIDGPFPEVNQLTGGCAIVHASSPHEALGLGKRFMPFHTEILGSSYVGELEVRQLAGFQPEAASNAWT